MKTSVITKFAVLVLTAGMLLVMPTLALVAAVNEGNGAELRDDRWLAALWVFWGSFCLWMIFDTRRFLSIFTESIAPMGAEEATLTLTAIANLVVLAGCLAMVRF